MPHIINVLARYNTRTMSVYSRRKYTWTGCVCVVVYVCVSECVCVSEWVSMRVCVLCVCDTPCVVCQSFLSLTLSRSLSLSCFLTRSFSHSLNHSLSHTHIHTLNPEHKPITSDDWETPMNYWPKGLSCPPLCKGNKQSRRPSVHITEKIPSFFQPHSVLCHFARKVIFSTWMRCPKTWMPVILFFIRNTESGTHLKVPRYYWNACPVHSHFVRPAKKGLNTYCVRVRGVYDGRIQVDLCAALPLSFECVRSVRDWVWKCVSQSKIELTLRWW